MKQSPFLEKINNAGKSLAKLTKRRKQGFKLIKYKMKRIYHCKH